LQPGQMAYDRAITVFSPDGRLFQVEYAREAVKRGTTTIGIKFSNGVLLLAIKSIRGRLIEPSSREKIFVIDDHIGVAIAGLAADARILVEQARLYAQIEKLSYGEPILVQHLVRKLCDIMQNYTQYGGVRPFGTSLLVAGMDSEGKHLLETDPSGVMTGYKADSIGRGREKVMEFLEKHYREDMGYEEALALAIKAIKVGEEMEPSPENTEIGVILEGEKFRILPREEVGELLERFAK